MAGFKSNILKWSRKIVQVVWKHVPCAGTTLINFEKFTPIDAWKMYFQMFFASNEQNIWSKSFITDCGYIVKHGIYILYSVIEYNHMCVPNLMYRTRK